MAFYPQISVRSLFSTFSCLLSNAAYTPSPLMYYYGPASHPLHNIACHLSFSFPLHPPSLTRETALCVFFHSPVFCFLKWGCRSWMASNGCSSRRSWVVRKLSWGVCLLFLWRAIFSPVASCLLGEVKVGTLLTFTFYLLLSTKERANCESK